MSGTAFCFNFYHDHETLWISRGDLLCLLSSLTVFKPVKSQPPIRTRWSGNSGHRWLQETSFKTYWNFTFYSEFLTFIIFWGSCHKLYSSCISCILSCFCFWVSFQSCDSPRTHGYPKYHVISESEHGHFWLTDSFSTLPKSHVWQYGMPTAKVNKANCEPTDHHKHMMEGQDSSTIKSVHYC